MSKDYSVLNRMIRDSNDKLVVAYDKGYKQGVADTKEDMKNIIESAEMRGYIKAKAETTVTLNEKKTNDYEKYFEGCDRCIFEFNSDVSNPCRFCKHNDPSYTESHFVPKPCDHEWVKSNGFVVGIYPIHYCKKCKLLRIEV